MRKIILNDFKEVEPYEFMADNANEKYYVTKLGKGTYGRDGEVNINNRRYANFSTCKPTDVVNYKAFNNGEWLNAYIYITTLTKDFAIVEEFETAKEALGYKLEQAVSSNYNSEEGTCKDEFISNINAIVQNAIDGLSLGITESIAVETFNNFGVEVIHLLDKFQEAFSEFDNNIQYFDVKVPSDLMDYVWKQSDYLVQVIKNKSGITITEDML